MAAPPHSERAFPSREGVDEALLRYANTCDVCCRGRRPSRSSLCTSSPFANALPHLFDERAIERAAAGSEASAQSDLAEQGTGLAQRSPQRLRLVSSATAVTRRRLLLPGTGPRHQLRGGLRAWAVEHAAAIREHPRARVRSCHRRAAARYRDRGDRRLAARGRLAHARGGPRPEC